MADMLRESREQCVFRDYRQAMSFPKISSSNSWGITPDRVEGESEISGIMPLGCKTKNRREAQFRGKLKLRSINLARRLCISVFVSVLTCIALLSAFPAQGATGVAGGVQWLASQVQADGSLLSESASIATVLQCRAETDRALRQLASTPSVLTNLVGTQADDNTEYLARQVIALSNANQDVSNLIGTLSQRQNYDGGFGGADGHQSNALDTAWALLAFNTAGQNAPASAAIAYLQTTQEADGAYAVNDQESVYISAYVLMALRSYASTSDVSNNIQSLSSYLLAQQTAPGVWENQFMTALVYSALHDFIPLSPIGIQTQTYLLSSQLADGSWLDDPYVTSLILLSLPLTTVSPNDSTKGTIVGKIVDGQTGIPLTGVTISLAGANSLTMLTGTDGAFSFSNVPVGSYGLTTSLSNYGSLSTNTVVKAGQLVDFGVLQMLKSANSTTGTVKGVVTDALTHSPLGGVTVSVNNGAYNAITNANGGYEVANVSPGMLNITANMTGYYQAAISGNLTANGSLLFSPAMTSIDQPIPTPSTSASITGIVLDASTNQALPGVTVQVTDANGIRTFGTGNDGRFSVTNVSQSPSLLPNFSFTLSGYNSSNTTLLLDGAPNLDIGQVRLRRLKADQLLPDLTVTSVKRQGVIIDPQTLRLNGNLEVHVANIGTSDAPANFKLLAFYDVNRNGRFDVNVDSVLGTFTIVSPIAAGAETVAIMPVQGTLPFRDAPISVWADSDQTLVESNKTNNVNTTAAAAEIKPNPGLFNPVIKFNALSGHSVVTTPYVIDLKIPGKTTPSIVSPVWLTNQWSGAQIAAVSGNDGQILFLTDTNYPVATMTELAVGDIDGDGLPEILAAASDNQRIYAFDHLGQIKWVSDTVRLPGRRDFGGAISIADLDGDGIPEIVIGTLVFNNKGKLIADGRSLGGTVGTNYLVDGSNYANISVVADIDLDGRPEIIAGPSAYRLENGVLKLLWTQKAVGDGFVGIANFNNNSDPYPGIVVVSTGTVSMLDHLGNVIWGPVAMPGGGVGGAPTIADVDGDGIPEIGVAGGNRYVLFNADGSVRWQQNSQDHSSSTGSTAFDFIGNGSAYFLYRDEQYLRVFNGDSGNIVWQIPMSSGTGVEYPVVADVDGDGHAKIVISADHFYCCGGTQSGIYVIGDASNSWVNTRKIWNQHSYHITNVNEDGSIPSPEQNSWQVNNTYRLNARPGVSATAVPDITASFIRISDQGGMAPSSITVRIGNGGGLGVDSGMSIAYYNGQPGAGGLLLGTAKTTQSLASGDYEDVTLTLNGSLSSISVLYIVADDDGTGKGVINDFDRSNNTVSMTMSALPGSYGIAVSTDKSSYGANSAVQISAVVGNHGSFDSTVPVRMLVQSSDGVNVAVLETQNITVTHGGQQIANAIWNTGATLVGNYQVKAQLLDNSGASFGEANASFGIGANGTPMSASLTSNKQSYLPSDVVQMDSRVSNTTANQLLQNLTVVTTVTSPDGTVFTTKTEMLPQLAQGNLKDYVYSIPLNFAPAGVYNANLLVEDATGAVIATANANFTVQSTAVTGAGLTGTLSVSPKQLPQGALIAILYSARNVGNSALTGLPLIVSIIDPVAQRVMAQYPTTQTIAVGGNYTAVSNWTSTGTVGTNYVAVLSATLGGQTLNLAQDTFTLIAPPIKLGIQQSIPALGSVLALISCQSTDRGDDKRGDSNAGYCGEGEDDNDGHQNDNNKQLKSLCLPQRVQAVTAALTATGLPYHLSQTVSDFKQAFRTGLYNIYWISNAQYVLGNALAGEVGEAVYAGNSLILDGGILARNHVFDTLSGVSFQGNIGQQQPITLDGLLYPTAQTLPTLGQAQWLKPASGAVIQATFNYAHGYPGNDHDNHADSHAANQPQTVPGMVSNAYGNGIVLTLGFDLSNTLTTYSASWQTPLDIALAALTPTANLPTRLSPGTVLPVTTEIDNQAQTVDVDVKTQLPGSARYLNASPSGSFNATNNTLDWMFNLPAQQTRSQTLWFLVPASAGDYSVQTLVGTVGSDNTLIPYGQPLSLSFSVITAAQTGANAIALLRSYALRGHDDQNLRDRLVTKLQDALNNFSKNTLQGYETTIADLLDIANRLGDLTAVDTTAARADIDALLQEAQWRWTLLPQPVPANKRH